MVDVGGKPVTERIAVARGEVRMRPETLVCLTGRIFQEKFAEAGGKRMIGDAEELEAVVSEAFGLGDPEIRRVWPRVEARHWALFGDRDLAEVSVSTFGRPMA